MKYAVSTRGVRFDMFPGIEAYANLEYVVSRLEQFGEMKFTPKVSRTLNALLVASKNLLRENRHLREEITSLIPDFQHIRKILAKREKKSSQIEKEVKKWVYKLQSRLKRRKLESNPQNIKWQQPAFKLSCEEIWQQWIRLVNSYSEGLYKACDVEELEFTNNAKEQLFHHSKHHFKALLGRENVARAFLNHGGLHVQLLDIDFTKKKVTSVLLACETPLIEAHRKEFNAQYSTIRRTWRIREKDTGNFTQFKNNLTQIERP